MSDLSSRKEQILRAVIVEYVSSAEPVASEMIAKKYELGVRSATVRNELAEMAELGYIIQPHASSGRIPSDQGYRYFVDRLLKVVPLDRERRRKVDGATEDDETLGELLSESTRALSRLTHLLSAATTVRNGSVEVRAAVVTSIGPGSALLVLALSNGHVENRVVECPKDMTLDDLGRANQFLGSTVTGKTLRSLTRFRWDSADHGRPVELLAKAASTIRAVAKDLTQGKVIMEGQEYIFAQPEFQRDRAQIEVLIKSLQDETALYEALSSTSKGKTTITIGRENKRETHYTLSILHHSFYVKDEHAGAIALIGPTRMNYEVGTRLLSYTAQAISETLTKVLG